MRVKFASKVCVCHRRSTSGPWQRVLLRSHARSLALWQAFADWSDDREFYVVDGAVRKCPQPSLVWTARPQGDGDGHAATSSTSAATDNTALASALARAHEDGDGASNRSCTPFGGRIKPHSLRLPGVQRPHGEPRLVSIHAECSRWVEQKYARLGSSDLSAGSHGLCLILLTVSDPPAPWDSALTAL